MRFETVFEKQTTRAIDDWLAQLGLTRYADAFAAAEIDLDVLAELTDTDLAELDVKLGDRKRILRACAARATPAAADARQSTVLYCDLVDSTDLAVRLEPRELRAVMSAYHARCADVVAANGGEAHYLGGGITVTFASAQGDIEDAKRAIRCALALLVAIGDFPSAEPASLQARIGIATGSERGSSTSSLAGRLQRFADPQSVLIAGATRRLLGDAFTLAPLGSRAIISSAERVEVWRVEPGMPGPVEPGPFVQETVADASPPQAKTAGIETHVEDDPQPIVALHRRQAELERAERLADSQVQLEALHAIWTLAFSLGDFSYTLDVTKRGLARYDAVPSGARSELGDGHDAGVCAALYRAIALIVTGRIGDGRGWVRRAETAIERTVEPYARCAGQLAAAIAHDLLGDFDVAIALAGDARKLAAKHGFVSPGTRTALISGAARISLGDRVAGIRALASALDDAATTTPASWRAYYLVRLALAEILAGDERAAAARLEEAERIAKARGGCMAASERERAAAGLLRLRGAPRESVVERLADAMRLAREQDALLLELRSASDSLEFELSFPDGALAVQIVRIRALLERIEGGDSTFDVRRARKLEQRAVSRR